MSGRGRVNKLQILGDELDVDQSAGDIFEVPTLAVALLGRDRLAHFGDVAGGHLRVARPAQHGSDEFFHARRELRRSRHDRARVSAMCSQVQASSS